MSNTRANRSLKSKSHPASLGGWVLAWLLWADMVVKSLTDLIIHLTGLLRAVKELLRSLGYVG
jgi:hypothetical protein